MEQIINISIGLGLIISFVFSETMGVAAGGMVVPGYMALFLDQPGYIVMTIVTSLVVFGLIKALSTVMIIYGRRRTMVTILVGFVAGAVLNWGADIYLVRGGLDLGVIGHIIPGLIAIWYDRQGVIVTTASMLAACIIIRLGLIVLTGGTVII